MREQEIGVADEVALIGVDDLVAVSARCLEILCDPSLHIINPFAQHLGDGKGDLVGILDHRRSVVEDRLPAGAPSAEPAENQGGEHHKEQDGKQQQAHEGDLSNWMAGAPECAHSRSIGARGRGPLRGSGDGLPGFCRSIGGMCDVCGLVEGALLLAVTHGHPSLCRGLPQDSR